MCDIVFMKVNGVFVSGYKIIFGVCVFYKFFMGEICIFGFGEIVIDIGLMICIFVYGDGIVVVVIVEVFGGFYGYMGRLVFG